jgi:DNA-binding CsgD family transcriptional regulator
MNSPLNVHYGEDLTDREKQVLIGIAYGKTNTELCSELFLSIFTVKTYIGTMYRKLGVDNRVSAVIKAIQKGILPCPCPNHSSMKKRSI